MTGHLIEWSLKIMTKMVSLSAWHVYNKANDYSCLFSCRLWRP